MHDRGMWIQVTDAIYLFMKTANFMRIPVTSDILLTAKIHYIMESITLEKSAMRMTFFLMHGEGEAKEN